MTTNRKWIATVAAATLVVLAACGDNGATDTADTTAAPTGENGELVVYSGRNENLVGQVIEQFEADSGIDVEVRYADTSELTATLLEEGDASPADVFFSQDAGALAALADAGRLAELPEGVAEEVDDRFRDPEGRWTGVTGRARTIVYNPEEVPESEVPDSVIEVADPKWEGRIGLAPTNASFVSHVSALRVELGDEAVLRFLQALDAADPKLYDSNLLVVQAVDSGEIDLGLVNHYYALNHQEENPDASVANAFPDEGAFVNLAGVGIIEGTDNADEAAEFVRFLLSDEGQEFFRTETNEYPLVEGVPGPEGQPSLDELQTIDAPLADLGEDVESTTALIKQAGLT